MVRVKIPLESFFPKRNNKIESFAVRENKLFKTTWIHLNKTSAQIYCSIAWPRPLFFITDTLQMYEAKIVP